MTTHSEDPDMTTQLSTKFAALGVALMMNSLLIGGVALLFNGQIRHAPVVSLAFVAAPANPAAA